MVVEHREIGTHICAGETGRERAVFEDTISFVVGDDLVVTH